MRQPARCLSYPAVLVGVPETDFRVLAPPCSIGSRPPGRPRSVVRDAGPQFGGEPVMRMPRPGSRIDRHLRARVLVAASCGGSGRICRPVDRGGGGAGAGRCAAAAAPPPTLLWPAPSDPLERTVAGRAGARAEGVPDQPRPLPPGRVHRRQGGPGPGGHRDQHRGPRGPQVRRTRSAMAASSCATNRASHRSIPTTRRGSSTPSRWTPSRTPSGSSSPNGASISARPASGSTARRRRSRCTSAVSPTTGDPRAIELTDQKVIVIVVGTPPAVIPSTADFSGA